MVTAICWLKTVELLSVGGDDILPISTLNLTLTTFIYRKDDDEVLHARQIMF